MREESDCDGMTLRQAQDVMGILCADRPGMWLEMMRRKFCMGRKCEECRLKPANAGTGRSTYGDCMHGAIMNAIAVIKEEASKINAPNAIKRYVVTYVEYGDSVDGKARVAGIYRTHDEAYAAMKEAAESYRRDLGLDKIEIFSNSASVGDTDECGCEYSIDEVSVYLYGDEAEC